MIMKQLKNYLNVKADHDIGCISIEQYLEVYEKINLIKKGIKKYNLSPIEQLMYTYDIVRDRIYVEENDYESSQVSRSLSSVLTGDKIVCAGFANIFDEIAKQLDFKSMVYTLQFGEEYHARNMVYVKDEKYNINGIYFFDPTWDCKKENNDYLKSYKFFARTKSEMDVIHKSSNEDCVFLSPKIGEQYHINIDNAYFLKTILKLYELIIGVKPDFIKVINHDLEIEKKVYAFSHLADNKISLDTFEKILLTVRNIEYNEDNKYSINKKDLKDTINSYIVISEEEKLNILLKKLNLK